MDVIIAKNNINRYFESGQIDVVYLKDLSYDAVPEMQRLFTIVKISADLKEKQMALDLSKYFKERRAELENQQSWQSFNISRYRALQIIGKNG